MDFDDGGDADFLVIDEQFDIDIVNLKNRETSEDVTNSGATTSTSSFLLASIESNKKYKESLYITIQKLEENLHQIRMKRRALQSLRTQCKFLEKKNKYIDLNYYMFGAPFFKDESYFSAPINLETKYVIENFMLRFLNLGLRGQWNMEEKYKLEEAVQDQLCNLKNTSKYGTNPSENLYENIDWQIISANVVPMHTPEECKGLWNFIIRPDICKNKWSSFENKELSRLALQNQFRDWDNICLQLGTNRTALQCFIQFQVGMNSDKTRKKWLNSEDQKLITLVNKLKIGKNYIPWSRISSYFEERTKDEVYNRYSVINPNVRKGYFTDDENNILIAAVINYNEDFSAMPIEDILPGRTLKQVRSHYYESLRQSNLPPPPWDLDSDQMLIDFVTKHGKKWALVATMLGGCRTRSSCRHRHKVLQEFLKKNPGESLANAPRRMGAVVTNDKPNRRRQKPAEILRRMREAVASKALIREQQLVEVPNKKSSSSKNIADVDLQIKAYFEALKENRKKPGRQKRNFQTTELWEMQILVEDILNFFGVQISKTELEQELLSGSFYNNCTELEKLLVNFMINDYRKSANQQTSASIKSRNINARRGDFLYEPSENKALKTYIKKEKSFQTPQTSASPNETSINLPNANGKSCKVEDNGLVFPPNYYTLAAMQGIISNMSEVNFKDKKTYDELLAPSQQTAAKNFRLLFKNMFSWPALMSYVNPGDDEICERAIESDDEEDLTDSDTSDDSLASGNTKRRKIDE